MKMNLINRRRLGNQSFSHLLLSFLLPEIVVE